MVSLLISFMPSTAHGAFASLPVTRQAATGILLIPKQLLPSRHVPLSECVFGAANAGGH